jgi:actin-related protein 2
MELIWEYLLHLRMKVETSKHSVLVSEPPLNPKKNKEKLIQIMFEKFDFNSFFIQMQGVLCLYSSGLTTGTCFDSGDGVCFSVNIFF